MSVLSIISSCLVRICCSSSCTLLSSSYFAFKSSLVSLCFSLVQVNAVWSIASHIIHQRMVVQSDWSCPAPHMAQMIPSFSVLSYGVFLATQRECKLTYFLSSHLSPQGYAPSVSAIYSAWHTSPMETTAGISEIGQFAHSFESARKSAGWVKTVNKLNYKRGYYLSYPFAWQSRPLPI